MVLAATVGHLSVSGLSEPVTYTMPLVNSSSFYSCVYWDELGSIVSQLSKSMCKSF